MVKETLPVGIGSPAGPAAVIVKVTVCPKLEGFGVEVKVTVGFPLLTVCVKVAEVLGRLEKSPKYCAGIVLLPPCIHEPVIV